MKKILLITTLILMLMTFFSFGASAKIMGYCGEDVMWSLDANNVLTISGNGKMEIAHNQWVAFVSDISSLVIEEGVTELDADAFHGLRYLKSVSIPKSVTVIGENAFSGCSALSEVYLQDLRNWCEIDFDNEFSNPLSNGAALFVGNQIITDCILPDGVTQIKPYAFYSSATLNSVIVPEGVTQIAASAFQHSSIAQMTLPNSLKSIGCRAFSSCSQLTDITLPEGITSIENNAFEWCEALQRVVLPKKITSISEYTFENCSELSEVIIPAGVTHIGAFAFSGCASLQELVLPNKLQNIGVGAFSYCYALRNIEIPKYVRNIDAYAFFGCQSLNGLILPDSLTRIEEGVFQYCTRLTNLVLPSTVTYIGVSAFSECTSLTRLVIPNQVTTIDENAFSHCTGLKELILPRSITKINTGAFYACEQLAAVHYAGTANNWQKILFTENNDKVLLSDILCTNCTPKKDSTMMCGIVVEDTSYNVLSSVPNDSFLVEAVVTNLSARETCILFVALYDSNGKLLDTRYLYANPTVGHTVTFGLGISNPNGVVAKVKAFVLTDLKTFHILAEACERVKL